MFRRNLPFSSRQIDFVEIVTIPSSFVQTSQHEDRLEVDIQVEGEHLVVRPEEEELVNSILEGVGEVRRTFSRCLSTTKLQMAISVRGDGCQSRSTGGFYLRDYETKKSASLLNSLNWSSSKQWSHDFIARFTAQ